MPEDLTVGNTIEVEEEKTKESNFKSGPAAFRESKNNAKRNYPKNPAKVEFEII